MIHTVYTIEVCAWCYRSRVGGEFTPLGSRRGFAEETTFRLGLEETGNMNRGLEA